MQKVPIFSSCLLTPLGQPSSFPLSLLSLFGGVLGGLGPKMALVVQTLPNTEFAQHVHPHATGAMCWCLISNVLQHFGVWRHFRMLSAFRCNIGKCAILGVLFLKRTQKMAQYTYIHGFNGHVSR